MNIWRRRAALVVVVLVAGAAWLAACSSSHPSATAAPFTADLGSTESPNPCGALSRSEVAAATHTKVLTASTTARSGGRGDRRCSYFVQGSGATIVEVVLVTDQTLAADGAMPSSTTSTEPGTKGCGCLASGPVPTNVAAMVGTGAPRGSHPIAGLGRVAWWTVLRTSASTGLESVSVDMGHTLVTVVEIGDPGTGTRYEPGLESLARTVAERVPAGWAQQA